MARTSEPSWDLTRLNTFVRVAAQGNLTRAAALAGMPQPVVSRQIAKFEQECGGRLFLRNGRGVSLTELGQRVLLRVQAVLHEADQLSSELDSAGALAGDVRLGLLPSLYRTLVIPLFTLLRARHPLVRLHVFEGSSGQIEPWLATGYVDIGIAYRYGRQPSADYESLAHFGSFLIGGKDDRRTARKQVKFKQLDGLPLVLPGAPSGVRVMLDQLAKRAGISMNVVMQADSGQIQKAAAQSGAYTVLPMHAVYEEVAAGQLQASLIVEPRIDRRLVMGMTTARPASRACREVGRQLREMVGESDRNWQLHGLASLP